MNNIGNQLKELREQNNLTRKEAVDKLRELGIDISDKTLYGYESGRNSANADMFLALCKVYKCNNIMETFSDTVEDVLFTNIEWNIIEKYRALDEYGKETVNIILDREAERTQALTDLQRQLSSLPAHTIASATTRIISYYQRLASAGSGEYLFDSIPTDNMEVPLNSLSEQADFVLGVNGDSMEPTYHDGDKVYVEISEEISTGSIGIFTRGNECFIKELGIDRLVSHNQKYPDIPASEDIRCVGLVLGKVEEV